MQAAQMIRRGGMATTTMLVLQLVDQLLIDAVRLLQREKGLLSPAQHTQHPEHATKDKHGHAQVHPELPDIGKPLGSEDFLVALTDYHTETAFTDAAIEALVCLTGAVVRGFPAGLLTVRQTMAQARAHHHHATVADVQALMIAAVQQAHQAAAAQIGVLKQNCQIADIQLDLKNALQGSGSRVVQRQEKRQTPAG